MSSPDDGFPGRSSGDGETTGKAATTVDQTAGPIVSTDPLHRLRRFGSVQLRVNLRHNRGGMAQDGPGHVQAELPTEPRRRVVAELVADASAESSSSPALLASRLALRMP